MQYFEYDGKQFGYGNIASEIPDFKGARKITSLGCYPLKYHKNEEALRKQLIERGKTFVALGGVCYRSHKGMAFQKKKKGVVVKVNINGRIMIDAQVHRRINPNYPISRVRPKDMDFGSDDDSSDMSCSDCGSDSDSDGVSEVPPLKVKFDDGGKPHFVGSPRRDEGEAGDKGLDQVPGGDNVADKSGDAKEIPEFGDEEYLIASPVVLGFAFAEKLWLEFTISGVRDIEWNDNAYDSLVLEEKTKSIVKVSRRICPSDIPLFLGWLAVLK